VPFSSREDLSGVDPVFAWHKEKVMQPSMNDLVVRQVSALVSTTADAVCTSGENVPSMEAQFYESLAMHCAEKQRLAAAALANGALARTQEGVIYW
jgi:hypothetical protein